MHHEIQRAWGTRTGFLRIVEFCTGMVGVQCFFAISGFLITTLLLRETERTGGVSLGGFYRRRALRIFPAYFAYLGVLFLMTRSGSLELARHDWLAALTYTVNYVDHPAWEVNHVWSLSLEEQFYLIWPLAFMVFGPRGGRIGLPVFLALAPVFRVAARVWFRDHAALGYSSTLTGMDSIAAGCLLALLTYDRTLSSQWRLSPPGYIKLGLLSAAVLVASAVLCGPVPVYHLILGRTVNAAALCLLIWSLANRADSPVGQFLHRKSVVVVGVLSYSLYLWQQLFLSPTRDDWYCRWPQNIGLALLAAAVSYIFIERPFLRLKGMP